MPDDPLLTRTPEGATVRYRGRPLYSPGAPRSSAQRRARAVGPEDRTLYFVPSLGLGYGLDALLERCPASSHILCVEVDQTLMALGSGGLGGPLPRDPRLTVARTGDPRVVSLLLYRLGAGRFRRTRLVNLCGGYLLYRELYDAMFRTLESGIAEHWQNRLTSIHLGALWVKNCIENLPLLAGSRPLEELRAPGPVVVVGAGPSLDGFVPCLRRLRSQARLLAVDTALPALAAHGLEPDAVFILEAQQANLYDFLPLPDPSLPVVADLTAHPGSLRLFSGPRAFVLSGFADLSLFDRMEHAGLAPVRIPALGSVGVAACAAALELTEGEVLTCGLDFGYEGDKTHARGSPLHTLGITRSDRLEPAISFLFGLMRRRPLTRSGPAGRSTDAVYASYAASLQALASTRGRIRRLEPSGSSVPWGESFSPEGWSPPHVEAPRSAAPDPASVSLFLEQEISLATTALATTERLIRAGAGSGAAPAPTADEAETLRSVDYAVAHFPETAKAGGEVEAPTAAYLARLRHALLVYRIRMERVASRCRAQGPATELRP